MSRSLGVNAKIHIVSSVSLFLYLFYCKLCAFFNRVLKIWGFACFGLYVGGVVGHVVYRILLFFVEFNHSEVRYLVAHAEGKGIELAVDCIAMDEVLFEYTIRPCSEEDALGRMYAITHGEDHVEGVVFYVALYLATALTLNYRKFCDSWGHCGSYRIFATTESAWSLFARTEAASSSRRALFMCLPMVLTSRPKRDAIC